MAEIRKLNSDKIYEIITNKHFPDERNFIEIMIDIDDVGTMYILINMSDGLTIKH